METKNPAMKNGAFTKAVAGADEGEMTLNGVATKSVIMLLVMLWSGSWTWNRVVSGDAASLGGWLLGSVLVAFIAAMVAIFKPRTSPIAAPVYAVFEGLALGAISAMYQTKYHGLPFQAVALTGLTMLVMLTLYLTRIIKPTQQFVTGVVAATGAIALYYVFAMVLGMFGMQAPGLMSNGWMGIGVSVAVTVVAALNLILDFAVIEQGIENKAPKYMEWYGALGLMITLAWLYLEILRLLSKLQKR